MARNLSQTGSYSFEDDKNVVLSSGLIEGKGVPSEKSNKLTAVIYSCLFNWFGFNSDMPFYVSLFVFGLTNILLFLLFLKLFNFSVALIFSLLDIFMPVVIRGAEIAGFYEWAMLFFVMAVFLYLYPFNREKGKKQFVRLSLSGVFFALAALARNAFFISFIPFLIYDFFKNRSYQRAAVMFLFFVLILGIYIIGNPDSYYANLFLTEQAQGYEGHLWPDPYTYHFERDEYIKNIDNPDGELVLFLSAYNYSVSFKEKIISYFYSVKFYIREFLRIVHFGGALILFLVLLGGVYLYKKKNSLISLFLIWLFFLFAGLIFLRTSNWDHFLEIRIPIVLLAALGVYWLIELIKDLRIKNIFKYFWGLALVFVIVLHLGEASRWTFHEVYNTKIGQIIKSAEIINSKQIEEGDIIAVGYSNGSALILNYYTDKNFVYFNPETVKRLIKEQKLEWAFDQFGVDKVMGFSSELYKGIIQQGEVEIIDEFSQN